MTNAAVGVRSVGITMNGPFTPGALGNPGVIHGKVESVQLINSSDRLGFPYALQLVQRWRPAAGCSPLPPFEVTRGPRNDFDKGPASGYRLVERSFGGRGGVGNPVSRGWLNPSDFVGWIARRLVRRRRLVRFIAVRPRTRDDGRLSTIRFLHCRATACLARRSVQRGMTGTC